jgi:hypothetical protein
MSAASSSHLILSQSTSSPSTSELGAGRGRRGGHGGCIESAERSGVEEEAVSRCAGIRAACAGGKGGTFGLS